MGNLIKNQLSLIFILFTEKYVLHSLSIESTCNILFLSYILKLF